VLTRPLLLARWHRIIGGMSRMFQGQLPFLRLRTLVHERIELTDSGRLMDSKILATYCQTPPINATMILSSLVFTTPWAS
jgi:hypothetical protein